MEIDIESLERATLDAVAPPVVESLAGWLIPIDSTTIGRAISAVPLRHDGTDTTLIGEIESLYKQRGHKAQFRIADVVGLTSLHTFLREHGYVPLQPTLTMVGRVSDWPQPWQAANVQLSLLPPEEWKRVYLSDSFDPLDGANRVRALSRSSSLVYAHLSDESGPAAAGAASFSQGWVGLHGLRTVTDARRKGYAQALIAALGTVAVSKGINRSFLQVEEGNLPAIDLYRRLGFQTAWRYHYWRRES